MSAETWDALAPSYEDEVFNVLAHDRDGLIASRIERLSEHGERAVDLGCGTGRFVPLLAKCFRKVFAIDLSTRLLARARRRCDALGNVTFLQADLAEGQRRWPAADFGLSVNVVMMPSLAMREAVLSRIRRSIRRGGHFLMVVPALESALLSNQRRVQWNVRKGFSPAEAVMAGLEPDEVNDTHDLAQGIVMTGGVRTKHYLREELAERLSAHGLETRELLKIEYPWSTEFVNPPRWMRAPYPWDWLALAQRVR